MAGRAPVGADKCVTDAIALIGPGSRSTPEGGLGCYSPGECIGAEERRVEGRPDPDHISTSFAERRNLSMRMGNRRMTRLTNAFSKNAENHAYSMAIYFMHYNYVRIHKTLRCTPAMALALQRSSENCPIW